MLNRARSVLNLLMLVVSGALILQGCTESEFTLRPDSRLPAGLELPKGVARSEVTVRWTNYFPVGRSTLTMYGPPPAKAKIAEVSGDVSTHPISREQQQRGQIVFPTYWIFTA